MYSLELVRIITTKSIEYGLFRFYLGLFRNLAYINQVNKIIFNCKNYFLLSRSKLSNF